MNHETLQKLARLLREQRVASLGTLRDGAPLVSMTLFTTAPDLSCFYILASTLAQHTQDFLKDRRVSLMIAETDPGEGDPQTLARLSIRGEILSLPQGETEYEAARILYLEKYPASRVLFDFKDFALYRLTLQSARFVAGFAQAYNLTVQDFIQAADLLN